RGSSEAARQRKVEIHDLGIPQERPFHAPEPYPSLRFPKRPLSPHIKSTDVAHSLGISEPSCRTKRSQPSYCRGFRKPWLTRNNRSLRRDHRLPFVHDKT